MGRSHTPEERGGAEPVYGVGDGVIARVAESVNSATAQAQHSFGFAQDKAAPLQRVVLFALCFYKMYLSALMGGTCRFEPTCSTYAFEAVERFGVRRGCWLTLKRLARCQPLSRKFGYDPVPESWPTDEEEPGMFPQGQKPEDSSASMSDLKVRPPTAPGMLITDACTTEFVHVDQKAHS
jgi:uncharacterized protein